MDASTPSPKTITFSDNGTQSYTFKDGVGNSTECSAEVTWINK